MRMDCYSTDGFVIELMLLQVLFNVYAIIVVVM